MMAGVGYCNNELKVTGIPLNALMSYDKSKERYVIKKQLVEMMSNEYQKYSEEKMPGSIHLIFIGVQPMIFQKLCD